MTVDQWMDTPEAKSSNVINFFSNGGEEIDTDEVGDKEVLNVTETLGGFYDIEINVTVGQTFLVIYEENGMDVFKGSKVDCDNYVQENNNGDPDMFGVYLDN